MADLEFRVGPSADCDRYRVGLPMGAGTEGVLYRGALDVGSETTLSVAVKMLHPIHRARLDDWTERWGRQIELLRSLQAPGVVPVRDGFAGPLPHPPGEAVLESTTLYLVMNWIDGEPLDVWAARHPEVGPEERLKLLLPVAGALDLMHSGEATGGTPVIHGDVKPSNILVRPNRETVLVDFGLLRLLPGGQHSTGVTGTPGYLAPEVRAAGHYSPAADRYALGVVAYFLLTGVQPRIGESPESLRALVASHHPRSPDLADHVMDMLDDDPAERPRVLANWCAQLRNSSLEQVFQPGPLPPIAPVRLPESPSERHPAEPSPPMSRPTRRRPLVVLLAALTLAAAIPVALLTIGHHGPPRTKQTYVFAPAALPSGLLVTRAWSVTASPSTFTESLRLTNGSLAPITTAFDEVIPEAVSMDAGNVSFSPSPSRVIKADPIVRFDVRGLAPGRSEGLTYSTTLSDGQSMVLRHLAAEQTAQEEFLSQVAQGTPPATLVSMSMPRNAVYLKGDSSVALDRIGLSGLLSNGDPAPPSILKLVEWKSRHLDVATVRHGMLLTHKQGSTTITAQAGGIDMQIQVVVGSNSSAGGASVAPSSRIQGPTPGPKACAPMLANQLIATGSATQLITVNSPSYGSTTATLRAWKLASGCWRQVFGPWEAKVGTTGVSDHKNEGDGATPTGIFGLGATMYGVSPNPGVSFPYHQLVCGDWWDEDPTSADYNTFQHVPCGTAPPFGGASEALWQNVPAYDYLAVIGYNAYPVVSGAGSAIFLHVDSGSPTAGCVGIPAGELTALLDWLKPTASPAIVIGTDAEIRAF